MVQCDGRIQGTAYIRTIYRPSIVWLRVLVIAYYMRGRAVRLIYPKEKVRVYARQFRMLLLCIEKPIYVKVILKLTGAWNALATKDLPAEPGLDFEELSSVMTSRGVPGSAGDVRSACAPGDSASLSA